MTTSHERSLVGQLIKGMPRSSRQLNEPHESDSELLDLRGLNGTLAITTDGVDEEIATGLYDDPYLAGWMVVVVNASDIAAVGAKPLGIVICESLPPDMDPDSIGALQRGIADAARAHGFPILGGDTNVSSQLRLSATALGVVPDGHALTRRGAAPGDLLFASGRLGSGSAFAGTKLLGIECGVAYQPHARTNEGQLLRDHATSSIDTSDGFIAACDELMRSNDVGLLCTHCLHAVLDRSALEAAGRLGLPPWTMLAGPHGEFELLFTIPPGRRKEFLTSAQRSGWMPWELGMVTPRSGLRWQDGVRNLTIDATAVRNLFVEVEGDPKAYVRGLLQAAS